MKFRWRLFGFFAIFYSLLVAVPSPCQDETEARFRFTLKGGEGTATRWLNLLARLCHSSKHLFGILRAQSGDSYWRRLILGSPLKTMWFSKSSKPPSLPQAINKYCPPPTIPNCHLWLKDEVKYQEIWVNCFDPCYFRNHRPILLTDLWGVVDFPNALSSTQTNLINFFFSQKWAYRKIKRRNTYMFHCYCWKEINCLGHKCRHACALTLHWISWKCHAIIEQISPFSTVFARQRRDII